MHKVVQVLGAALVAAGVAMWSVAAGVIAAGVVLVVFGVALEQDKL